MSECGCTDPPRPNRAGEGKGVSGATATAAVVTFGVSALATGLRKKHADLEMLPMKSIGSVRVEKDGLPTANVVVSTPAGPPPPPPPPPGQSLVPAPPGTPAGWIGDSSGRHELRYWDGGRWTEHVSDAGTQSSDPT